MTTTVVRVRRWFPLILLLMDCDTMDSWTPPPPLHTAARSVRRTKSRGGSGTLPSTVTNHNPEVVVTNSEVVGVLKRSRRRHRTRRKPGAADRADVVVAPTTKANVTLCRTEGNLPDVYWRAIPLEHVRHHPRVQALPDPSRIVQLSCLEDVRKFRQDSWQWHALHAGRCTTSQAVAALGFLEPLAGEFLNVPVSLRRGGRGAFVRLRQPAIRTMDEINQQFCSAPPNATITTTPPISEPSPVWHVATADSVSNTNPEFVAEYTYQISPDEIAERHTLAQTLAQNDDWGRNIRQMWGNTQEATALLTALNFFAQSDPTVSLEEVGMCGAGLDWNLTTTSSSSSSSLLIGATPDGILRHSTGRMEALEVKNHCPFYRESRNKKHPGGKRPRFQLGMQSLSGGIFAHHVPQLQMEMLCLGPDCRSAVLVRQTATAGAIVLRMHRDDDWIAEMLYWLHQFQIQYVERNRPPPQNFFWNAVDGQDRLRYRMFVNKTNEIRNSRVEVVGVVPNDRLQRSDDHSPLFLD